MKIILGLLLCGLIHALPYNKTTKYEDLKAKTDLKTKEDKLFHALLPKVFNHTGANNSRSKKQASCCPCSGAGPSGTIGITGTVVPTVSGGTTGIISSNGVITTAGTVGTSGTWTSGGNVPYVNPTGGSSDSHLTTCCQPCIVPAQQPNPQLPISPILINSNAPQVSQQSPIFIKLDPPQVPQQTPVYLQVGSHQSQQQPVYVNVESPYQQPPVNINLEPPRLQPAAVVDVGVLPNQGQPGYITTSGILNEHSHSEKIVKSDSDDSSKCDKDTYVVMPPVDTQSSVTYVQFPIIQQQTPVFPQIVVGRSKLIEACLSKNGSQPTVSDSDSLSSSVSTTSSSSTSFTSSEAVSSGSNSAGPSYSTPVTSTAPLDGGNYHPGPLYQPAQYYAAGRPEVHHQEAVSSIPADFNQPGPLYQQGRVNQPGPLHQPAPVNQPGPYYQPGPVSQPPSLYQFGPANQPGPFHQPGPVNQPGPFNGFGQFNQHGPFDPRVNVPRFCFSSNNPSLIRFPTNQGYWVTNRDQNNNALHPAMTQSSNSGEFQQMQQQGPYSKSFSIIPQPQGFVSYRITNSDDSDSQIPQLNIVSNQFNSSDDQVIGDNLVKRYYSRSVPAEKSSKRDASEENSHLQGDASSVTSDKVKPQQSLYHDGKVSTSVPQQTQGLTSLKKSSLVHSKNFKNNKDAGELADVNQFKVGEKKKYKN